MVMINKNWEKAQISGHSPVGPISRLDEGFGTKGQSLSPEISPAAIKHYG